MARIRKKQRIDAFDKEILRVLSKRSPLVGKSIAEKVGLSSPAISPRLRSLESKGILKSTKLKSRNFSRNFGEKNITIKAPRSIFWDIDLIQSKKTNSPTTPHRRRSIDKVVVKKGIRRSPTYRKRITR